MRLRPSLEHNKNTRPMNLDVSCYRNVRYLASCSVMSRIKFNIGSDVSRERFRHTISLSDNGYSL